MVREVHHFCSGPPHPRLNYCSASSGADHPGSPIAQPTQALITLAHALTRASLSVPGSSLSRP
jgi:hypothetical protein